MASPTERPEGAAEKNKPEPGGQRQPRIDFSRYRMNPVQVSESSEATRAETRRIGVVFLLLLALALVVVGIVYLNQRSAERSPLDSLSPEERAQAQELVDNLLTRIPSLQNYVYDVQYATATTLRIFVNPTVLEKSGEERRITDEETESVTKRVVEEFRAYGPPHKRLEVETYVVENPGLAAVGEEPEQHGRERIVRVPPAAKGSYDPETDSITVELTARVALPEGTGRGEAPPGQGHLGERPGAEMPHDR